MTTDTTVAAIAGHGLAPMPDEPIAVDADAWADVRAAVVTGRITGHLVAAAVDGVVTLHEAAWEEALDSHRDAMGIALHLERLLVGVVRTCRDAGVDPIVLKGPAVAALDYPRPELRDFGDIDLLVPSDRMSVLADRFVADGCTRGQPELRDGIDDRFGKGITLRTPEGWEIDWHRTLAPGPIGLVLERQGLLGHTTTFELAGETLTAYDRTHRFLHACVHVVLGNDHPRLSALRDVAQIGAGLDPDAVTQRADELRLTAVVQQAVLLSTERVAQPHNGLVEWAGRYQPDERETKLLATYIDGRTFARQALASLGVLSPNEAARYAWALAWPTRENLESRGRTRWTHLRALARSTLPRPTLFRS